MGMQHGVVFVIVVRCDLLGIQTITVRAVLAKSADPGLVGRVHEGHSDGNKHWRVFHGMKYKQLNQADSRKITQAARVLYRRELAVSRLR